MASDVNNSWGSLHPGDIIVADEDFALVLEARDDGWPLAWLWLVHGNLVRSTDVSSGYIPYLFEGRAIVRYDGQVVLCQASCGGWNLRALRWWDDAQEAGS